MPTCTNINTILLANPCLSAKVLTEQQRKLLKIWYMANELATNGGTDYTAVLGSTLITDSNTYIQLATPDEMMTADIALDATNATTAGASLSTDYDTLMGSVAPLTKATERQLDGIILYLKCALGAHQSPPA